MTDPAGTSPAQALRTNIAAIEQSFPLRAPMYFDQTLISPRLDRADAKVAYLVDYIAYLEQRIAALEARPAGS
ncbi:MAG: hypothetical protein J7484_09245 [Microbacterium sp.]|nr:hypothetical protein [Microbacterium sp.]